MIYIVESENQILLENGEWRKIGLFSQHSTADCECPPMYYYEAKSFQGLQNIASQLHGMANSETLFFHRPKVEICLGFDYEFSITERNFKRYAPYKFRTVYKPYHPTMEWLMENLSADDFAQYAKDREWNSIVIAK